MYFKKNTLKNNIYYIFKHPFHYMVSLVKSSMPGLTLSNNGDC